MKSIFTKLVLGVALIAISSPAIAREGRGGHGGGNHGQRKRGMPGAAARIERQKAHIQRALDKGKITQDQANQLNSNVDAIQAKKAAAMADGKITKEERTEIKGDLKASKQEIRNAIKPEDSTPGSSGSSSTSSEGTPESNN